MTETKDIDPFGYFKHTPFGWEDCGEYGDGATPLYDREAVDQLIAGRNRFFTERNAARAEIHRASEALVEAGLPDPVELWQDVATLAAQRDAAIARARELEAVHGALSALVEDVDPANHQSFCNCDPSVGYQCDACTPWPALADAYAALASVRPPAVSPNSSDGEGIEA